MDKQAEKTLRYIFMAPPRSGSTWFCNLLEKNGIIKEAEEQYESLHFEAALKEKDFKRPFKEIVEQAFEKSESSYKGSKIQAFKCLSSQFRNLKKNILNYGGENKIEFYDMIAMLCGENTKIIILDRKNTDEMASSWINAIGTEQWVYKYGDKELYTIDNIIIFHKFHRMFHQYIYKDHMHIKKLASTNNNFLQLYYEDIQADPKTAILKVFEFLGLEAPLEINLNSDYRKQRTEASRTAYERYKRFRPKFLLDHLVSFFEFIFGSSLKYTRANGRTDDFHKRF